MLTLITLTPQLTVAPQIEPSDIEQIAGLGFKSVINNRPDGEESGQPLNQVIEQHADQLGLVYVHLPVVGGQISEAQIHQFGELLQTLPQPILAFVAREPVLVCCGHWQVKIARCSVSVCRLLPSKALSLMVSASDLLSVKHKRGELKLK